MKVYIKSILIKAFASCLMLAGIVNLSSCTDGFNNMDPGGVDKEELDKDGYAVSSAMRTLSSNVIGANPNLYQFTDCLLGGNFGRYLADSNAGFNGKNFATFIPENHWVQFMFNNVIPETTISYKSVINSTSDELYHHIAGILKVLALYRVSDVYGPIPYSQVGEDGKLEVPYDSVEDIYKAMFDELDVAIDYLTDNQTVNFSPNADNVYNGNTVQWIKLANSIKLRLGMRLVNVDVELSKKVCEEAVNHPIGVMTTIKDSAYRPVAATNPLFTVTHEWNDGDAMIAADILCYMNGYEDPRRPAMFTQSKFEELSILAPEFVGIRSGINIQAVDGLHSFSKPNINAKSKLLWMNASEVAFLRAEGALRGWNMGSDAETLYKQGVEMSFEEYGVSSSEAVAYLADNSKQPTSYADPLGFDSYNAQLSNITIAWEEGNFERNLERIITQKWIAIFPLGIEAWSEYRRTGYPKFMPVVVNNSGGTVSSTLLARRVRYPAEEYTGNGKNVQTAVSNYLKGPDNMGTNLWWAKKN